MKLLNTSFSSHSSYFQGASFSFSWKAAANQLVVKSIPSELCDKFARLKIIANTEAVEMEVGSSLLQDIRRGQLEDTGDKT
jgi:hypothetical protein